jgi:hypothetical protein
LNAGQGSFYRSRHELIGVFVSAQKLTWPLNVGSTLGREKAEDLQTSTGAPLRP